jgi:hypothetical protein
LAFVKPADDGHPCQTKYFKFQWPRQSRTRQP